MSDTSANLTLEDREEAMQLFGTRDQYLKMIRDALGVKVVARGEVLHLEGTATQVDQAERAFAQLRSMLATHKVLTAENVRTVLAVVSTAEDRPSAGTLATAVGASNRAVRPRTDGQATYVHAMRDNDLVFCIGPAGTGKTYLAVGMAVNLLRQAAVKKIVLVRPAVEAGERLGFLPGDMAAKINPYLRPLFDGLNDMMEAEQVRRYTENDIIEIAPLAFMRGRTLNNAVIILDEGQNTTTAQMKMFLTRMGHGSKIIVTGDITQVDLPRTVRSGLTDAMHRLSGIERIAIVHLTEKDIVRHPLVQAIVLAYDSEKPARKGKG
jgi:phosphate starvation-inducible protein PhoH and related proteins